MKTTFRKLGLALAAGAAMNAAQAGVLTYQDVVFTTTWTNNILTLEIDAAEHSGDWSRASMLGALSIKEIGSFKSVSVTAAPQGAGSWQMSARELNARGCAGGGGARTQSSLCLTGAPIALTDNMVFTFAFSGIPDLDEPHLKVNFLDNSKNKVGDLLSRTITASAVIVPPPGTPVTPPVTPPPTPPVTPPVTVPDTTPALPPAVPPAMPPAVPPISEPAPPATPAVPPVVTPPVTAPIVTAPPEQVSDSRDIPEPQSFALVLAGLVLMGTALRKRR